MNDLRDMKSPEELHNDIATLVKALSVTAEYESEVGYYPTYAHNLRVAIQALEVLLRP